MIFISYSHDTDAHKGRVLALAQRLRGDGFEVQIDQFVKGTPAQGWPRWMLDELEDARFVLVVCSETYNRRFRGHEGRGRGKGTDFEGAIILQVFYDDQEDSGKFIPVIFTADAAEFIPKPLKRHTYYYIGHDQDDAGYGALVGFLSGQSGTVAAPVGTQLRLTQPGSSGARPIVAWSGRPALPKYFVGRSRELVELDEAVLHSSAPIVVVRAIGGQGKTTLVAKWLADYEDAAEGHFAQICYFSAYRFGVEYVGFLEFAAERLLPGAAPLNANTATLSRHLVDILRQRRTLIVVDGIERWLNGGSSAVPADKVWSDESRSEAYSARGLGYLLQEMVSIRNGSKLVMTTRAVPKALDNVADGATMHIASAGATGFPGIAPREAVLLLNRLGVQGSDSEKRKCGEELNGHPLSLTLLAGNLKRIGKGISARGEVYSLLAAGDVKLAAILAQAKLLCGTDATVLEAASICPENAPVDAIAHAIDRPGNTDTVRLTVNQLADWGLMSLGGAQRSSVQLHPLVRTFFASTISDAKSMHHRLATYFANQRISDRARSLSRVAPRIWSVDHAAASGDYDRAVSLLIEEPLSKSATSTLTLSTWFQLFGQSAFEMDWMQRLARGAPAFAKRILLNSAVIAAQRCGMSQAAAEIADEAISIED
ncbi:MAG TPA: SEFIR domain-containing protein [Pyrinomonadaceae bacterium]|nr:SEFIR domain-containing protein [Pyrinomonadaceae bacterium]